MKKKLIIFSIFAVIALGTQAQLIVKSPATTAQEQAQPAGKLIITLAESIKPSSFLNAYSKDKAIFLNKASNITEVPDMLQNVVKLAIYIKPEKYKAGVASTEFIKAMSSITTMEQANNLLKKLENSLRPDAVNPIWKLQKNGWLADVDAVSQANK
ncbi:MAG: hypothetical protein H7320_08595 [Ferruginibacter sp.]|nr:hypothetical protein [Ferruginibacter sp.]